MNEQSQRRRTLRSAFYDPLPEEFENPDLNAHLKQYFDFGFPVVIGREAQKHKGRWQEVFGREAPLCLDIGSGNGFFLTGMAQRFPSKNWLGVEIRYKRVVLTAKKLKNSGCQNARILRYDNWSLGELFTDQSLDGLYTNHPDPWSKKKQAKKRILARPFIDWAAKSLKPDAEWRIKTDFETHIESMLSIVPDFPFDVVGVSKDAHRTGFPWPVNEDVTTNYERKFIEKGEPIFALRLRRHS